MKFKKISGALVNANQIAEILFPITVDAGQPRKTKITYGIVLKMSHGGEVDVTPFENEIIVDFFGKEMQEMIDEIKIYNISMDYDDYFVFNDIRITRALAENIDEINSHVLEIVTKIYFKLYIQPKLESDFIKKLMSDTNES